MKVVSDYTYRIGEGRGEKKTSREIPPGEPFELPDEQAKRDIARGLARDPEAEAKARKQAEAEAKAAAEGKPVGGKKAGGKKAE